MKNRFRLRAEFAQDFEMFEKLAGNKITDSFMVNKIIIEKGEQHTLPDVEAGFYSELPIEDIVEILKQIPDGHVMVETINLAHLYTGERFI